MCNLQKQEQKTLHINVKPILTNSKFKNKNRIGNLSFINSLEKEEITSNDTTKTEILNSFFSSAFVEEENTDSIPL